MATLASLASEYGNAIINVLPPWMVQHPEIAEAYLNEMVEVQGGTSNPNSAVNALETIRVAPQYKSMYDAAFPGLRREDGSLRMSESLYQTQVQDMRSYVQAVGIDPDVFNGKYGELIGGDVDASEFGQRVNALHSAVILNAPEVGKWYSENYNIDMTNEAILGSLMDPDLGESLLSKRISSSQVGGYAAKHGFGIDRAVADMLSASKRLDSQEEAEEYFGQAASLVPVLSALSARHNDPNDEFDLADFSAASIFDDPEQRRRISRLIAQEKSTFTGGSSDYARDQLGNVAGLERT